MFIALALRYDLHRSSHQNYSQPYAKPFFVTTMIAYAVGLIMTVFVMHYFQSAQPALLYLRLVFWNIPQIHC
jgi:minor histocompatibility antigen H13